MNGVDVLSRIVVAAMGEFSLWMRMQYLVSDVVVIDTIVGCWVGELMWGDVVVVVVVL